MIHIAPDLVFRTSFETYRQEGGKSIPVVVFNELRIAFEPNNAIIVKISGRGDNGYIWSVSRTLTEDQGKEFLEALDDVFNSTWEELEDKDPLTLSSEITVTGLHPEGIVSVSVDDSYMTTDDDTSDEDVTFTFLTQYLDIVVKRLAEYYGLDPKQYGLINIKLDSE